MGTFLRLLICTFCMFLSLVYLGRHFSWEPNVFINPSLDLVLALSLAFLLLEKLVEIFSNDP